MLIKSNFYKSEYEALANLSTVGFRKFGRMISAHPKLADPKRGTYLIAAGMEFWTFHRLYLGGDIYSSVNSMCMPGYIKFGR